MLPKSLHTVRILVAVARIAVSHKSDIDSVLRAAAVIGYPNAASDDPLIVRAAAALAKSVQS